MTSISLSLSFTFHWFNFLFDQLLNSSIFQVTLPKTLKADVILHGTEVDQVIVRGLRENATTLSKKVGP